MRIAMIGAERLPSRENGTDVAIKELSVRMAALDHTVTVYNHRGVKNVGYNNINTPTKDKYDYEGVHVRTAFTIKNKLVNSQLYYYFATLKACKSNCNVIHYFGEASGDVLQMAKKKGKKCVVTIDGLDWKRYKNGSGMARKLKLAEKKIIQFADKIIVTSEDDAKYFKETYNRSVAFIQNGINEPVYSAPKVIKLKHALNGEDYILYVGRISPEKEIHTLIEAYSKSGIEAPLVLAGSGDHSDNYYQTIKAFVDKFNDKTMRARRKARIIMTGLAQGRELEELYGNAVMFVLPSTVEGMSIALAEAMSYGNICLVSDIPQNNVVVSQHGFCFPAGDMESLRDSLRGIISNLRDIRESDDYTKEAIGMHAIRNFRWDETVKKTLEVYQTLGIRE